MSIMSVTARHPYVQQPDRAYWPKAVRGKHPLDIEEWHRPKFSLQGQRIAAAGSCFAQHIGRHLRASGFDFVDTEPAPTLLAPSSRSEFGYELYSARFGNVYTSRQLLQLFQRTYGEFWPAEDYWVKGEGVVDPFRPTVEPEPYSSVAELRRHQRHHLERVREMFDQTDVLVFTLGLTEAWCSAADGAAFPMAPGTVGGTWDPQRYRFVNLQFGDVLEDMRAFLSRFRAVQPHARLLLTVSPVPLVATATSEQVVVATTYSKSVLRAAAGTLAAEDEGVDYFPSYEIVSATPMRSQFFETDMREVSSHGVAHVMEHFFAAHPPPQSPATPHANGQPSATAEDDDVVCDQELLAAFAG